ncbi:histidine phosphatase family protein [Alkaliphilus hydrothermalis]|uniref:Broad specificity phosphatase PhoE n=1 Tax=Alkaliphilus hydrothermalis TaxID=1482730 RepID=A0ABS2NN99_9FIRM|nr:histidine phosphatase family protein [Alkaliphilus hydrothermalis]MBM7614413.1 broad specificity phosphatase PhoE [Alkaliphilus hydrothermalis]
MTEIYFVRHGETDDNRDHNLCGWINPSLNKEGLIQAERVAQQLKNESFDAIYTSGLKRTNETAAMILGCKHEKIQPLDTLKELNFGDFEGRKMVELEKEHPQLYQQMRDDFIGFRFPGGESLREMHHRVNKTMKELISRHDGEKILIVAHSGVIRSIMAELITGDMKKHWNFKIDHCSVSKIEAHGDFYILTKLNE